MFGAMTCYTETWLGDISHVWGDDMLYRNWLGDISHVWGDDMLYRNLVGGYLSCLGR